MHNETMLIVNAGTNGMKRTIIHKDGTREDKTFPPNVPVDCSEEMGEYLLAKYCDPTMAVFFRKADGNALNVAPVDRAPSDEELDQEIEGYVPETRKAFAPIAATVQQKRKYNKRNR